MSDAAIERTDLPSGVRLVTERIPEARSVSLGIWAAVGSRDEPEPIAGASHFLEHLLFKGTEQRSARSIALAVDAVGGEMNAYTSREHTAYYLRLPVAAVADGLGLLADVVARPAFRSEELEAEREVILEELLMTEDTPDDLVLTALYESLFPDHALGRETLGTHDTVSEMTREDVESFHAQWYRPANLVMAAAGAVDHGEILSVIDRAFGEMESGSRPVRIAPPAEVVPFVFLERPVEQVHLALGWRALSIHDEDRYALWVANHVLGGGLSSRLFQAVREERGLAYTVFSSPTSYVDTGSLVAYAGTSPGRLDELLEVTGRVLEELRTDGITVEEHRVALGYLEGSMMLGLEDSGARMSRLGTSLTSRDEVIAIDDHIDRIRRVTIADVNRVLVSVLGSAMATAVVGPAGTDLAVLTSFVDSSSVGETAR